MQPLIPIPLLILIPAAVLLILGFILWRRRRPEALAARALARDRADLLRLSLARGLDQVPLGQRELPWLHRAVYQGAFECLEVLLAACANPNQRDFHGRTPLLYSLYRSGPIGLRFLMDQSAAPHTSDLQGRTPLHVAVACFWDENDELTSVAQAYHITPDLYGQGSAIEARGETKVDLAQRLLAAGANLAATDNQGGTVWHYAVSGDWEGQEVTGCAPGRNLLPKVELLLKAGFSRERKDKEGRTPYDIALQVIVDPDEDKKKALELLRPEG